MNRGRTDPIIVIGMHRSGTSLLSRILSQAGVFMGADTDRNHESYFFQKLNIWLLNQCGGRWDHPGVIDDLLVDMKIRTQTTEYLRQQIGSPKLIRYLGLARTLSRFNRLDAWGWKDPRNTFTLPLWMDVFPNARIINVYRHGVDVAASLQFRQFQYFKGSVQNYKRRRWLYELFNKRGGFYQTPRCSSLDGGISVWGEHMERSSSHVDQFHDRALNICFEEFLSTPEDLIALILEFCEVGVCDTFIRDLAQRIDIGRAYAFREVPDLVECAIRNSSRLAPFGYGPEGPV